MYIAPRFRLPVCITLLSWLPLPSTAADTQAASPGPETIQLPTYEITADRVLPSLKKWHYVAIPGYEILSDASAAQTRDFIRDFYLLKQVTEIVLPSSRSTTGLPTYIVLCDKLNDFGRFLPLQENGMPTRSDYLADEERAAIVVDFTFADNPLTTAPQDPYRNFYMQYFRQIVRRSMSPRPPLWVEEGLVQLLTAMEFDKNRIVIGGLTSTKPMPQPRPLSDKAQLRQTRGTLGSTTFSDGMPDNGREEALRLPPATPGEIEHFNQTFAHAGFMPLTDFFAVQSGDATTAGPATGPYFAQAYLFTHMCLYGRGQRYQEAYYKLAAYSSNAPVTEEVFRSVFGMDFKEMEDEMRGYVTATDHKTIVIKIKNGGLDSVPPYKLREATDAESGRISGEVMSLAGKNEEALQRLVAPYVRGQRDTDLLAALGLAELKAGHTERARKFLEFAVNRHTTRSRALLELSNMRLAELKARLAAKSAEPVAADIVLVQAPLIEACKAPYVMPSIYEALAQLWTDYGYSPVAADFQVLQTGALRHPRRLKLTYQTACIAIDGGRLAEGRVLVEQGLANANDEDAKGRFEKLLDELRADPKPGA